MSDDREKLKALLLSEEIAQLKTLNQLLNDQQLFTQKVSEVLDHATDLVIDQTPEFQRKFSRIDSKAYAPAIKENRQTFIDALLPIIGPMIRRSVTTAIRRFVADVNRAVEMGISVKALKWRWQSFRTGVPFAEIVFNNTIEYQVQQVFLIDNHTGLLIEHAGHEEALLGDKDAMSAMLTAIQDFVKDSVSKESEGLSAAELGDNLVWVVHGNKANIAAVIKGAPTGRLRELITRSLEEIHIDFHWELTNQSSWNNNPPLHAELDKLLLTKSQSDDGDSPKSTNFWPWLLIILGIMTWLLWSQYKQYKTRQEIAQQLGNTPGFTLTSLAYDDGKYHASGLQDPLADMQHIDPRVVIKSKPYMSLENEMIDIRLKKLITQPGVSWELDKGVLQVNGYASDQTVLSNQLEMIKVMPGINQVINNVEFDLQTRLKTFLDAYPAPKHVKIELIHNKIHLTGIATKTEFSDFMTQLEQQLGPSTKTQVITHSREEFKEKLQSTPLNFTSTTNLNTIQQEQLDQLAQEFGSALMLFDDIQLKLSAHSDCQGSLQESNENNQLRMSLVRNYLISQGMPEDKVLIDSIECKVLTQEVDLTKIGVWFEVLP